MKTASVDRLTSRNLSEAVRESLLGLIVRGDLRPGGRLNEVHLAESFGISRGPIREAARELEGQGFLFSRPNQGFYVAEFTANEIRDIHEAKDWMEAAFISDVATHMDVAARAEILADAVHIDASDRVAFSETLFRFRLRATARVHNRFLADLMVALYRKFYIVSAVVPIDEDETRRARVLATQRAFWTALVEGDVAKARAIMKKDTVDGLEDIADRLALRPNAETEKSRSLAR